MREIVELESLRPYPRLDPLYRFVHSEYKGDYEIHFGWAKLSDGNTYSVELEMTLEHR